MGAFEGRTQTQETGAGEDVETGHTGHSAGSRNVAAATRDGPGPLQPARGPAAPLLGTTQALGEVPAPPPPTVTAA